MCGVSGILYKKATGSGFGPVGDDLVKMLESMTHRGKDSSGITIAGEDLAGDLVIRIWTGDQRHRGGVRVGRRSVLFDRSRPVDRSRRERLRRARRYVTPAQLTARVGIRRLSENCRPRRWLGADLRRPRASASGLTLIRCP